MLPQKFSAATTRSGEEVGVADAGAAAKRKNGSASRRVRKVVMPETVTITIPKIK